MIKNNQFAWVEIHLVWDGLPDAGLLNKVKTIFYFQYSSG